MSLHYTSEAYQACQKVLNWLKPMQARHDHEMNDQIRLDMAVSFLDLSVKAMQGDTESGELLRELVQD